MASPLWARTFKPPPELTVFILPPLRKLTTALMQCVVKYAHSLKMALSQNGADHAAFN
jgi:hypothetical protein